MRVITLGKNELGSYGLYSQRLLYKDQAFPFDDDNVALPMDLWYAKPFYARMDPEGFPIYPIENRLKRLDSSPDKNLFVLNFVADAFEDFRKNYLLLNKEDASGTVFEHMIPHQAYSNPLKARNEFVKTLHQLFVNEYIPLKKRYEKIITFRDFLKLFKTFMSEMASDLPLTLTNYILSSYSSPLNSGVMIEIADIAYSEDEVKCVDFFQNVCFSCYTLAAQKFGFKIDKNVPWRLIADLKSPCMQKYMAKYYVGIDPSITPLLTRYGMRWEPTRLEEEPTPVTFNTMFHQYYNKTYLSDINVIRDTLATFYFSFISADPVFTRYSYGGKCGTFKKEVIERQRISKEMIAMHFSDAFWLNYYIQILSYEITDKKTRKQLREIVIKAQTKLKQQSFESAVSYIFESFKENMLTST